MFSQPKNLKKYISSNVPQVTGDIYAKKKSMVVTSACWLGFLNEK